jgi:hypothetical protein
MVSRSIDSSERACALVKNGVFGLRVVSEAQELRFSARDGAHLEGVWLVAFLEGLQAGIRGVFKVEPVVAVLHAENMSLNLVVVGCCTKASSVEVEVDQSALDVEEAAGETVVSAHSLLTVGVGCSVDILESVAQVEVLALDFVSRRRPNRSIGGPREDVDTFEFIVSGERHCMGYSFRTVGTFHLHAIGDRGEVPALHRWLSLVVHDKGRNARLCLQRLT